MNSIMLECRHTHKVTKLLYTLFEENFISYFTYNAYVKYSILFTINVFTSYINCEGEKNYFYKEKFVDNASKRCMLLGSYVLMYINN